MHFRLLGHIEVVDDGTSLTLGGIRARATLGYLLLNHNSVIPVSRLMKALWPNGTPATGRKMLHNAISHLRGVIGTNSMTARAPVLLTHAPGYFLRVQGESVDMICFRQLVDAARSDLAAGRWEQAADTLRGALALWRGPAMVDLVEAGVNWAELTALENDRRAAIECLVDADLALGRHAQVISELETQLQAGPLRERMAGQLMRALYHCGRQSDALALYQRTRTALIEEFGLDPSPELQQLERAILNHALVGGTAVRPSADQPAELIVHSDSASPLPSRPASAGLNAVPDVASDRVVPDTSAEAGASVSAALTAVPDVASDRVVPDTSAGAEASVSTVATDAVASEIKQVSIVLVRAIKETGEASDPAAAALTHERTTRVVEAEAARWGGTMAGTLGSLWMVVFGVPVSGEFDAWHAARAARTISHRLTRQPPNEDGPDGDPSGAVVVATGKALVRPSGGSPSAVSGAVFDRAMGQLIAARPGEVSMCEQTAAAGRTTERRTLSLVNVPTGGASEPFVGRDHDMRVLQHAWAQVRRLHHPHLVTVLGPAGMGKTRLLAEFTGRAAGADPAAECLIGSCAPAEPGGTGFDALADIVKARCGVATDGSESHTRARLASAVTGLSGLNRPDWVLGHLCDLVFGTTDGGEDAVSAWCSFLEATVVERPAVLVLEDAHCAADAVLDVVDQLASSTGPLLTVVTARPEELLGRRPGWGGGKRYASATVLQPLDDRDIRELAATRLGRRNRDGAPTLVDAVVTKAGGNPFFALELAATLAGSADRPVSAVQHATGSTSLSLSLPPAVRAVLDAQIDTLPLVAKTVLLDAVVLGASFCGGAVAAIGSACAADVEQGLRHLERLDLVARNGQLSPAGRPEYEFRISALRDVAYERLVPAAREEKQRIVAGWRFRLPDSDKLAS
ncbi:BTAD domain-containing putative transcriptional regulator [Salinispora arenicola]|uniref:BTAD domain-containing putative transcriptional regulator n=1 Tax=Salinispora arenicola TaxID=168697 RepID=UPI00039C9CDE|nr:BTAD domain-containing putative transcriptional regulator [Salinispora arenicola]